VAGGVRAILGGVVVGDGLPVAVMGVLNVSPESFYAGSVRTDESALVRAAMAMVEAGATLIDVGARSTAPYLETAISVEEETDRLARAVAILAGKLPVPVSADTMHAGPAAAALEAGARVINDVSGLADPALGRAVAAHDAGLIAMASPHGEAGAAAPIGGGAAPAGRARNADAATPLGRVRAVLARALQRAAAAGIRADHVVLDPGIGFFRDGAVPADVWDVEILAGLATLRDFGRPLMVGVSRKSFLGVVTGRAEPAARLAGSLAAAALAVAQGAALVRAHDVAETIDAVRVAERVRAVPRP
jgi:dihydropteroate synthase